MQVNPKFEELKASGNLPSPSGVALEIIRLTQIDNVSLNDVLRPIKADPVLAGRVLKLANSAANAGDKAIIALPDAIVRLGFNIISKLAMTLSILDANRSGLCQAFDYQEFWSKSLMRGLIMQEISKCCKDSAPPEEAFTIGLVSEIGWLALAKIYPEEFNKCLEAHQDQFNQRAYCRKCEQRLDCISTCLQQLIDDERTSFGIDHNQITLGMLEDWGLPIHALEVVRLFQTFGCDYNLTEFGTAEEKFAAKLKLATLLTGEVGTASGSAAIRKMGAQLGISEEQFSGLLGRVYSDWAEWKNLLNLDLKHNANNRANCIKSSVSKAPLTSAAGLRITIVEDDRIQLNILSNYLKNKGHSITVATSGDEALQQILRDKPQVLITDYHMEPLDGVTLCKALRATKDGQAIYIILITADSDSATLTTAFRAGVNDFIAKPINQAELDARLLGARRFMGLLGSHEQESEDIRNYAFELATTARRLEMMALTDQLTSLANRRYAYMRFDQEWAKLVRNGSTFAILSLDLDFFKQVNDTCGHDAGDQVLIHFADILKKSIRTNDIACRMGGEEFIVIASDPGGNNVSVLGERIREMVESCQPENVSLTRKITVSIGAAISNLDVDKEGWKDTLKRSDQALYEAKAAGRNRFRLYDKVYKRQHERYHHMAPIRVKNMSSNSEECLVDMVNLSQSGLFLSCAKAVLPNLDDILELQATEIEDPEWRIARVVRLTDSGFAVEFVNSTG